MAPRLARPTRQPPFDRCRDARQLRDGDEVPNLWMNRPRRVPDRAGLTGTDLKVLTAPFDVVLGPNVVEADLLVARREDVTERDRLRRRRHRGRRGVAGASALQPGRTPRRLIGGTSPPEKVAERPRATAPDDAIGAA